MGDSNINEDKDTDMLLHDGSEEEILSADRPNKQVARLKIEKTTIEESLVKKGYFLLVLSIIGVMGIAVLGFLMPGNAEILNEAIRILASVITFLLGIMFATSRK